MSPATRFAPPTVMQRGATVRAVAKAMHEAGLAMKAGERAGRLTCAKCGSGICWSGNGKGSAGSCSSCKDVRWAT